VNFLDRRIKDREGRRTGRVIRPMCHGFDYRREPTRALDRTDEEEETEATDEPTFLEAGDPAVELDREFEDRDAETPADD